MGVCISIRGKKYGYTYLSVRGIIIHSIIEEFHYRELLQSNVPEAMR